MNQAAFEIFVIFLLLMANGLFAMAEIAVVSARKPRLRRLADEGNAKARIALDLAEAPNRFLSTVQVGITLVGIFAGAFGGATLTAKLTPWIAQWSWLAPYADKLAFGLVVAVITYFSLVLGELVPKRFGLSAPESIAMFVAGPMNALARTVAPVIAFLGASTDLLLRLLGFKPEKETSVTEDEVRVMMQEGLRAGAFNQIESRIVHGALELDQLPVREIMTPRPKIVWLNQDAAHDQIWHKIVVSRHSHFPVYANHRDQVVGTVSIKAIYAHVAAGLPVHLRDLAIPPLIVPETQLVLHLVESFKQSGKHIALVTDEFGSIVGLVTLNDVVEALVGEFATSGERARPEAKKRDDGTWLVDATLDLESVERAIPGLKLGGSGHADYQTLAGFLLKQFGSVPKEGQTLTTQGYVFEVLDMDAHRIDKVLVLPAPPPAPLPPSPTHPSTSPPQPNS